jgi:hypothetical protein
LKELCNKASKKAKIKEVARKAAANRSSTRKGSLNVINTTGQGMLNMVNS